MKSVHFQECGKKFKKNILQNLRQFRSIFRTLKMAPLKLCQQIFKWFYMCPWDERISEQKDTLNLVVGLIICVANMCDSIAAVQFFRRKVHVDLEESLYSVLSIVAYSMIVGFNSRKEIRNIFKKLLNIQNESKNKNCQKIYLNHNQYIN